MLHKAISEMQKKWIKENLNFFILLATKVLIHKNTHFMVGKLEFIDKH